jgi:hypothetical protein
MISFVYPVYFSVFSLFLLLFLHLFSDSVSVPFPSFIFVFSYFTAVSGTSLYESWVYSSFNIVLGLPIIFFGFLDRDVTADFLLRHPQVHPSFLSVFFLLFSSLLFLVVPLISCFLLIDPDITPFFLSIGLCNR